MNWRFRLVTAHLSGSRWKPRSCHCSRSVTSSSPEPRLREQEHGWRRQSSPQGCSIRLWRRSHPRCCCSSIHLAIPLQGAGMLIKQQRGTGEPTNTSVVLCHGLTTPMNRGCGSYGAFFIPIPSMVEVHKFLFRSGILLCL